MAFYPNECSFCKSTINLKRCTGCNMMSYCGEIHQKIDWNIHQDICKIISSIRKQRRVAHPYENLRGTDVQIWIRERKKFIIEVQDRMDRPLTNLEISILKFPRACFVCHDVTQNRLKNCPGCPLASFCKDHPSSSLHEKDCGKIKYSHDVEISPTLSDNAALGALVSIVPLTPLSGFFKTPSSMREYMNQATSNIDYFPERLTMIASRIACYPLTISKAFQELNLSSASKVLLHVGGIQHNFAFSNSWEILLHLFPNLNSITIVLIESTMESSLMIKLCNICISRKKQLILEGMRVSDLKKPNLSVFFDLQLEEDTPQDIINWRLCLEKWKSITHPLLLTTVTKKDWMFLSESLRTTPLFSHIVHSGKNNFTPLISNRDWREGGVYNLCEYMIVIKERNENNLFSPSQNEVAQSTLQNMEANRRHGSTIVSESYFNATTCHSCHSSRNLKICKRCKMISYCGVGHQKKDLPQHKDLCKVILRMLVENESSNLFNKLKTEDEELWLKVKIDLMRKAKAKLGRPLLKFEEKMFLFPKTCFVCHESDLSVLKSCECGVTLCKTHKDSGRHKNLCRDLFLALKMETTGKQFSISALVKVPSEKKANKLPPSMKELIDSYMMLKDDRPLFDIANFKEFAISDFLSRPLSFLYALEKLNFQVPKTMVVHVIGAINREVTDNVLGFWTFVLYWLRNLEYLMIVFIGPELLQCSFREECSLHFFARNALDKKSCSHECYSVRYVDYVNSNMFVEPDIIVGFNLEIHESELGIVDCTWKDTILTLSTINVPFFMTSGSKKRALKDHRKLCNLLGRTVDYAFCEKNPYSSFIPERDFETEGVRFSNNYIIAYKEFNKVVPKRKLPDSSAVKLEKKVDNFESTECSEKQEKIGIENSKCRRELETKDLKCGERLLEVERSKNEKDMDVKNKLMESESGRIQRKPNSTENLTFETDSEIRDEKMKLKSIKARNSERKMELEVENKESETKPICDEESEFQMDSEIQNKTMKLTSNKSENIENKVELERENKEIETKSICDEKSEFQMDLEIKNEAMELKSNKNDNTENTVESERENKETETKAICDEDAKFTMNSEIQNKTMQLKSNKNDNSENEVEAEKESKETEMKLNCYENLENAKCEIRLKAKNEVYGCEMDSLIPNKGFIRKPININPNYGKETETFRDQLQKENFLLKQENTMLKENFLLKKENEHLKKTILKLEQEIVVNFLVKRENEHLKKTILTLQQEIENMGRETTN